MQKISDFKVRFHELEREICNLRSKHTGMTRGGKPDLSSGSGEAILEQPFTVNNNNNAIFFNGAFLVLRVANCCLNLTRFTLRYV